MSKNIAIVFAGGVGARMGSGLPKQFIEVNGKPIIIHTLDIFEEHPDIDEIYVACKDCLLYTSRISICLFGIAVFYVNLLSFFQSSFRRILRSGSCPVIDTCCCHIFCICFLCHCYLFQVFWSSIIFFTVHLKAIPCITVHLFGIAVFYTDLLSFFQCSFRRILCSGSCPVVNVCCRLICCICFRDVYKRQAEDVRL